MPLLFISGAEIFFILFVGIMVFGADKIPGIAKTLGEGMRQLRDARDNLKREIQESAEKQGLETDFAEDVRDELNEVKKNVDEITGTLKRNTK